MNVVLMFCALVCAADESREALVKSAPVLRLSGTVTTTEGQPIANASVILRTKIARSGNSPSVPFTRDILALTICRDDRKSQPKRRWCGDHCVGGATGGGLDEYRERRGPR
jgi:hypothetical protein